MDRTPRTRLVPLLACLACALPARAQITVPLPPGSPSTALRWALVSDHPSGIYYAKAEAKLTLTVDNTSDDPVPLSGTISFGPTTPSTPFKPLAVFPLAKSLLQPGQRATIPLTVTFAAAGPYELRHVADGITTRIPHPAGLQCIFAPRLPQDAKDSPWLTLLPPQAPRIKGFLADYIAQTSVHCFLIDERFAFDASANVGLGFGASLGQTADGEPRTITNREIDAFLAEAAAARGTLVLRVTVPSANVPDPRTVAGFKQYIADAVKRSRGILKAIVVAPDPHTDDTPEGPLAYRAFYLAGYEAAKAESKTLLMLGAGTAHETQDFLLDQDLAAYVDAFAVTDAAHQPAWLGANGAPKRPLWVLPPQTPDPWHTLPPTPPAGALAQGAAIVPVPPPALDRGVAAHLLGGAVLYQRVHLAFATASTAAGADTQAADETPGFPINELPFIAVFQGDGYALAAIAGLSAGTAIDALYPDLARTRTVVEPLAPTNRPTYPNLEVGDDTHTMRVVNNGGAPVECRVGDSLFVPAGDKIMYILQAGTADELAGSIRPAVLHRFPLVSLSARYAEQSPALLTLRLTNIRPREVSGTVRVIAPPASPAEGEKPRILAEKDFVPISPGKRLELPLDLPTPGDIPLPTDRPLIVEVVTSTQVQRTAVRVETK